MRPVEVKHDVELAAEAGLEVVTDSLGLGAVDHTDRAFQPLLGEQAAAR